HCDLIPVAIEISNYPFAMSLVVNKRQFTHLVIDKYGSPIFIAPDPLLDDTIPIFIIRTAFDIRLDKSGETCRTVPPRFGTDHVYIAVFLEITNLPEWT